MNAKRILERKKEQALFVSITAARHLFCLVKLGSLRSPVPPLLQPGTSLPGAQRSKALQFLGAGVETELCSSLQKCLGGVTFDLG